MKFTKTRDVKTPSRGTQFSAGIDFYIPNDFVETVIPPGGDVLIPSGIKVCVPAGYALIAFNKSGIATKTKLTSGACVVDEDYRGEVHLHLINNGIGNQIVSPGQKILQFILIEVNYENTEEISVDEYNDLPATSRGTGGFGSTGTV